MLLFSAFAVSSRAPLQLHFSVLQRAAVAPAQRVARGRRSNSAMQQCAAITANSAITRTQCPSREPGEANCLQPHLQIHSNRLD